MIVSLYHLGNLVLIQTWCTDPGSDWTSSTVSMTSFSMWLHMGTICRHVKLNQRIYRITTRTMWSCKNSKDRTTVFLLLTHWVCGFGGDVFVNLILHRKDEGIDEESGGWPWGYSQGGWCWERTRTRDPGGSLGWWEFEKRMYRPDLGIGNWVTVTRTWSYIDGVVMSGVWDWTLSEVTNAWKLLFISRIKKDERRSRKCFC